MRRTVELIALAPIHHGAFGPGAGNASLLRRHTLVCADGMPEIPCLSGNALRGICRRIVFRDLFERCKLDRTQVKPGKWDKLYAALANGGTLSGSEKRVDPEAQRALREALPPLSAFGGALYSYMLTGHLQSMGICWPVCSETQAAGLHDGEGAPPAEDLVEEVSLVRHVDREQQDPEVSGVTPMPTTFEALKTGARLVSELIFVPHATEIEVAVIGHALDALTAVGGKQGSGHGRVRVTHDLDPGPYRAWLEAGNPREALLELAETL